MSMTPTTDRRRNASTQPIRSTLSVTDRRRLLASLSRLEGELEARMLAAVATVQTIRDAGSLTDPEVQAPLMAALHALDDAERAASDLADARRRISDGSFGRCVRCARAVPVEPLELRLAAQLCPRCSR